MGGGAADDAPATKLVVATAAEVVVFPRGVGGGRTTAAGDASAESGSAPTSGGEGGCCCDCLAGADGLADVAEGATSPCTSVGDDTPAPATLGLLATTGRGDGRRQADPPSSGVEAVTGAGLRGLLGGGAPLPARRPQQRASRMAARMRSVTVRGRATTAA